MNTIVYEETLTGRPHDTSVQKAIVELLFNKYDPIASCIQEIQVSDSYDLKNNLYTLISKVPHIPIGHRSPDGSGILIRKDVPHSIIPLHTSLQAVACRVSISQPITL